MSTIVVEVAFRWENLLLAGSVHHPEGPPPYPAVLLMQGSGPSDRHADGYFVPIREAFLERGIATFAFDKPGCGRSTGEWRDYALEGRAAQSIAAVEVLQNQPEIAADRVGVWGQSQGGWLAQMLASRLDGLAFAIANSGPSIGVVDQDLYGCEHSMRSEGHSETDIKQALRLLQDLHRAAAQGTAYEQVERELLHDARDRPWYGYADIDGAADWALGTSFVTENYRPLDALRQIRCPFLAVFGGRDVLVPAWRSAEESGEALSDGGTPDATVVVFPQGDHRIRDRAGEFVPGYLKLLGQWTADRVIVP